MRCGASSPRSVSTPSRAEAPGEVPTAIERWLSHLRHERRLAAHTLEAYARDVGELAGLAAGRALETLASPDIRRFVATLHGRGRSPRSLARTLSAWRGLYAWLARQRIVGSNPCA